MNGIKKQAVKKKALKKNIRLFFVYFTFVTLGVSFGLYLILAFLLKLKDMVYTKRTSVFDL